MQKRRLGLLATPNSLNASICDLSYLTVCQHRYALHSTDSMLHWRGLSNNVDCNNLNTYNLYKMEATKIPIKYQTPTLTIVECYVEVGFLGSSIGDNEGNYIPDFEPENNL